MSQTYRVTLWERTEHVVEVEAASEKEARREAERGWKEGRYVDSDPLLLDLEPIGAEVKS